MEDYNIQNCYACYQKKDWAPHSNDCPVANAASILSGCTGCDSGDYACPIQQKKVIGWLPFNKTLKTKHYEIFEQRVKWELFFTQKIKRDLVLSICELFNTTWWNFSFKLKPDQRKFLRVVKNSPIIYVFSNEKENSHTYAFAGFYQTHKQGWNKKGATVFNIRKEYRKIMGVWKEVDSEDF